jgi:hypothetical protein
MKNSLRTATFVLTMSARLCRAVCGVGEVGHHCPVVCDRSGVEMSRCCARVQGKTWSIKADDTGQLDQLIEDQLMIAGARLAALLNARIGRSVSTLRIILETFHGEKTVHPLLRRSGYLATP